MRTHRYGGACCFTHSLAYVCWWPNQELLLEFIDPLGKEIHASRGDPDMLVELVGILAMLDIPEVEDICLRGSRVSYPNSRLLVQL
jgi:hypothetical protein